MFKKLWGNKDGTMPEGRAANIVVSIEKKLCFEIFVFILLFFSPFIYNEFLAYWVLFSFCLYCIVLGQSIILHVMHCELLLFSLGFDFLFEENIEMGFVFTNWLLSFLRPNSSSCLSFIYLFSITLFTLCSVHHEMWFVCLVLMFLFLVVRLLSSWGGLVFYWCFYDLSLHSLLITNLTLLVNASLQS